LKANSNQHDSYDREKKSESYIRSVNSESARRKIIERTEWPAHSPLPQRTDHGNTKTYQQR